jgi:hypothetical protein
MKVLLHHTRSGLYYAGEDRWVAKGALARDFEEVERAARWLEDTGLSGVEIALNYDDPGLRSRFDAHHREVQVDE